MSSLSEPRYDIQKQVNVYRAISKTNKLSENVVPSQLTGKRLFKLSLYHVKSDVKISASANIFETKQALASLFRKQNYFPKMSLVRKINSKSAFTTSDIKLNINL